MTIVRQAYRNRYTSISNSLSQNNDLSLKARGLMLYLLSLPNDWQIRLCHLCKVLKEGRWAVQSALNELKQWGYVHHHKMGFKEGWQYFVFEEPHTPEKFKEFLRTIPVFEQFGNLNNSGNLQLQKTKSISTKKDPLHKGAPPTEKEEEEISRRIKNRDKQAGPIVNLKAYKEAMLKDIREQSKICEENQELIEEHRRQAKNRDLQVLKGWTIVACEDRVEFTSGSRMQSIPYNVSEKDWELKISQILGVSNDPRE